VADTQQQPVCLSIAGLDPSGGAGIIADLKTFAAFGCYGAAAVTSITFQNTVGVFGAENQSGETVRRQIEPIFEDLPVAVIKTGMLPTADVIETVAKLIAGLNPRPPIVVDPVVRSTSGFDLIDEVALKSLVDVLFPLATVVTPNIAEAERIAKMSIVSLEEIAAAGNEILSLGARRVLIKGGHLQLAGKAVDYLFDADGYSTFEANYIDSTATHGTGCTLASAIAAGLARGNDLHNSIAAAKRFVTEAIRTAPVLGAGYSPVNHLAKI
jgi:hydroxymethylpyrimidine/phosphomethylpyrimidine kinase